MQIEKEQIPFKLRARQNVDFVESHLNMVLSLALKQLAKEKPLNPIRWLGLFLLEHDTPEFQMSPSEYKFQQYLKKEEQYQKQRQNIEDQQQKQKKEQEKQELERNQRNQEEMKLVEDQLKKEKEDLLQKLKGHQENIDLSQFDNINNESQVLQIYKVEKNQETETEFQGKKIEVQIISLTNPGNFQQLLDIQGVNELFKVELFSEEELLEQMEKQFNIKDKKCLYYKIHYEHLELTSNQCIQLLKSIDEINYNASINMLEKQNEANLFFTKISQQIVFEINQEQYEATIIDIDMPDENGEMGLDRIQFDIKKF